MNTVVVSAGRAEAITSLNGTGVKVGHFVVHRVEVGSLVLPAEDEARGVACNIRAYPPKWTALRLTPPNPTGEKLVAVDRPLLWVYQRRGRGSRYVAIAHVTETIVDVRRPSTSSRARRRKGEVQTLISRNHNVLGRTDEIFTIVDPEAHKT